MVEKKYYSISEVSQMLNIKEHVIRHWDSVDPKTKKFRIEDLSLRTKGCTRFFSKAHIKKLANINNLLKENGKRNYTLNLASKIISQNKDNKNLNETDYIRKFNKYAKIVSITKNLKELINVK